MTYYYKFMSLNNLRRFLDIIVNRHLYAARYDELNDPTEGMYLINRDYIHTTRLLRVRKLKTRICSLTDGYKHNLLWAHYADGHKGCCIKVRINGNNKPEKVNYVNELPEAIPESEGRNLLLHKAKMWEYESEYRCFRKSSWVNVRVDKIIFGMRVSNNDYLFYKKLIERIDGNIEVEKMSQSEIDDGMKH